jgi:O-antigen ligase
MSTKIVVLLLLPFLPVVAYLAIKYPVYTFMFFFCAASLEGGFVSEVRTITVTRVCFLLLVPGFLVYMLTRAKWKKYDPTVLILIGIFIVFYFTCFYWAPNQISASKKISKLFLYLAPCIVCYYLFKDASISVFKHFLALYFIVVMLLICYLYLQIGDVVEIGELSRRTAQRVFPFDPNSFARSFVVALTMSMGLLLCAQKMWPLLLLNVLLLGACLPLIIIAGSRSGIVIFACVLVLMGGASAYVRSWKSSVKIITVVSSIFLCGLVIFFYSKQMLPGNLSYRVSRLLSEPLLVIAENIRFSFYENSFVLINSAPFLGVGMRGYEGVMQYPHNFILEILIESGFIGLSLFLFAAFSLGSRCLTLLRFAANEAQEWFPVVFVMVFAVTSAVMFGLFIGEVSDHRVAFFLISILLALDYRVRSLDDFP